MPMPDGPIQPVLGSIAKQIIADVPTVYPVGKFTLYTQGTFGAQFEDISRRLQRQANEHRPFSSGLTQDIELPAILRKNSQSRSDSGSYPTNTMIQEIAAKATGVLKPHENWSALLRRPNIVSVLDRQGFDRISEEEPENIPGMQYILLDGTGFVAQYGGQPHYLLLPETNYPGVKALVRFRTIGPNLVPFSELLETGLTTVHTTLKVPTPEFLPEPKT